MNVVALGSSLGGLKACSTLLRTLPASFPAALLLVQHRSAEADPLLAELLARDTALSVADADDKALVLPGQLLIAPSDYHMLVERDGVTVALSTEGPVRYARPSVDVLFESVARAFGTRAIAVVLTGASDDGARGALAVKRAGGRVIVQEPSEAESAVSPRATLALFSPDAVLPVAAIAAQLCAWCGSSPLVRPAQDLQR